MPTSPPCLLGASSGRGPRCTCAQVYLRGLLLADVRRKNVEALALRLLGAGPPAQAARQVRALQQFIGAGAWDDNAILAEHQRLVAASLGAPDGVLILDGSDVPKRGDHSAGAAPQWCGATGKTDTCPAGVFLGSASRKGYTLRDRRLFLPEVWFDADHAARWRACHIPAEGRFQTKAELGAELVEQLQARGELPASWLVCDEWFGRNQVLWDRVDAAGCGIWPRCRAIPRCGRCASRPTGGGCGHSRGPGCRRGLPQAAAAREPLCAGTPTARPPSPWRSWPGRWRAGAGGVFACWRDARGRLWLTAWRYERWPVGRVIAKACPARRSGC
jgi:DDE superfamily endonuclease